MRRRDLVNLILRVTMECGLVAAFAYWGVHTGDSTSMKVALGIIAPAVGFGFWGALDFHQLGSLGEPVRLVQELAISGLAAAAWYAAGQQELGIALAALSLGYHALVYTSGSRLLKPRPEAQAPEPSASAEASG
jgi:hypothetical protein